MTHRVIFGKPARDVGTTAARKDRDAVVALLAMQHAVIANGLQLQQGELVVGTFGFLDAEDVRLFFLKPTNDQRQSRDDRINVPGGDLHWVSSLANLKQGRDYCDDLYSLGVRCSGAGKSLTYL